MTSDELVLVGSGGSPGTAGGTILPVTLTTFNAQSFTNGVLLSWVTASEINNAGFEVQRSLDGNQWELLDFVAGNGTTYETQTYTYQDRQPYFGANYYRLRQVDFDGASELSKVVAVEFFSAGNVGVISLFPNPAREVVTLELQLDPDDQGSTAILFNSNGQRVRTFSLRQIRQELSLSGLSQGFYTLQIIQNGAIVASPRLVKQ